MISADVAGAGPAVILLPAGVADRRMWQVQRQALLRSGYQVVTPDPRGFGRTPAGTRPWDPVDDVLELAHAHALESFALVGASAGGSVALQLAARTPERVTALVLLCPAAPDLEPSQELRSVWREEGRLVDAGDLDGAAALMARTFLGPEADPGAHELVVAMQRRAYELQLAEDAAEEAGGDEALDLGRVLAPTLTVAGAHDLTDFTGVARRVASEVRHGRHTELAWAGHLPSLERPVPTAELVLDSLDRVRAGAGIADGRS